jgi:GH35 family endo-1,4-beta-xylanase
MRLMEIPHRYRAWTAMTLAAMALMPFGLGAQTTLREAAAKAGLNFGVAAGAQFYGTTAYQNVVAKEFNMAVCENEMKMGSLQSRRGTFNWTRPDQLVAFAVEKSIAMRGHTLVWHSQSGFAGNGGSTTFQRAELLAIMREHITTVLTRYKGKIKEWDVVNEAYDGQGKRRTDNFWQTAIGDDFMDSAFVFAHRADPDAQLYYNDFSSENVSAKSTGIYEMVKTLRAKGIPIHGVGFQTHTGTNVNKTSVSQNIKRLGDIGVRVSITELEISRAGDNATPWNNLMGACLENYNCTSFITWGLNDGQSWLRDDCQGCLIFNNDYTPKPAVHAGLITTMNAANADLAARRKTFTNQAPSVGVSSRFLMPARSALRFAGGAFHVAPGTAGEVILRVHAADGSLLATLSGANPAGGAITLPWDGAVRSAGLHLVRMQAGGRDLGVHRIVLGR